MPFAAGCDSGSVSIKLAVLDAAGSLVFSLYRRHKGRPLAEALEVLSEATSAFPGLTLSVTGSTGRLIGEVLGAPHVNELSALALATHVLCPDVRSIVEMGGEDAKFILLGEDGRIADFSLSAACAAGTGSFLDQQASRMLLSIEDFAAMAAASQAPSRIAGRCSVFAKSDMIHQQQIAARVEDIAAGLCFAAAKNYMGGVARGLKAVPRTAFLGGVSLNAGMVRAFMETMGLMDLLLPEQGTVMGAIGAAIENRRGGLGVAVDLGRLGRAVQAAQGARGPTRPVLIPEADSGESFRLRHLSGQGQPPLSQAAGRAGEKISAYLGLDVGSISTNLAVIDAAGNLLAKRYLRTSSRPIEAVRQGLAGIGAEIGGQVRVEGAGTTGSGRYMTADFFGADVVKNEITAQAVAALHIDPEVEAIFEIGGQDSKFIAIKDGVIDDFEMNKACAAGTGSFLEEQAEKLDIAIEDEFAAGAFRSASPCDLGERCTVFMENSLVSSLGKGAAKEDLLAGLAYSIVENYLNRVVAGRKVGEKVFFQGGTAFNKAVVAAFENHLGRPVTVPPHHDITGAIGMALIARDHSLRANENDPAWRSRFKGFDMARAGYAVSSFACPACANRCEINKVAIEGESEPLLYGGRCEKYERRAGEGKLPDHFAWRERALLSAHEARAKDHQESGRNASRGPIGLPLIFFMHERLPYFSVLLWELGFAPVISGPTTRSVVDAGIKAALSETCFPVKAALGHAAGLAAKGLRLFIPSFVNVREAGDVYPTGVCCPLTQAFPYAVRQAVADARILAPVIDAAGGEKGLAWELRSSLAVYGVGGRELTRAMDAAQTAQREFIAARAAKANDLAGGIAGPTLVIVGRAYNAYDPGMNLGIPRLLADLGAPCLPMDLLSGDDASERDLFAARPHLYWRSGQRILAAARACARHEHLYPVHVGNFACGPDSFIERYFRDEIGQKSALHVEIDEHSAAAGILTRLEAFLDAIEAKKARSAAASPAQAAPKPAARAAGAKRRVLIPRMSDHALGVAAALRACGVQARALSEPHPGRVALAKKVASGKECYPLAVTLGDMLEAAEAADFDPGRDVFFMPGGIGPCRFGQYNVLQRLLLEKAGVPGAAIYSPMQTEEFYKDLSLAAEGFPRRSWQGLIGFDLLIKALHRARPLARDPDQAQSVYAWYASRLEDLVASGPQQKAIKELLRQARNDFADLAVAGEPRPVIGVVGEIFVRSNRFSNEDLVRRIERLGGRAWLSPVDEWVFYVNHLGLKDAWRFKKYRRFAQVWLTQRVQRGIQRDLESAFTGYLDSIHEPPTGEILAKAGPYLPASVRGEAVLSVGAALSMIERGARGIVNAMPFGCMPGAIVTGLLRAILGRMGLPFISIAFDGAPSQAATLQLETFMEQVKARTGA